MKNKIVIPGVALWHAGQRSAAVGGWALIVACLVAVCAQLATPGAHMALTREPMAHTYLWIGIPSVILYTSELFLAAAIANSMLYRSRGDLVLPTTGWGRACVVFLCPRLALSAQPGETSSQIVDAEPAVNKAQTVLHTATAPAPSQQSSQLESPEAQNFLHKCASIHLRYYYLASLLILASKAYALATGTSWYSQQQPQNYSLLAVLSGCALLGTFFLGIWLTITMQPRPVANLSPAEAKLHTPDAAATSSKPTNAKPTRSSLPIKLSVVVMTCVVIALIRMSLQNVEATRWILSYGEDRYGTASLTMVLPDATDNVQAQRKVL